MFDLFIRLIALIGIPTAALGVLMFLREIPRLFWGGNDPLMLAGEVVAWAGLLGLFWALRRSLARGPKPQPLLAPALDFLALRGLHPVVWMGLLALLVLPGAWYLHADRMLMPGLAFGGLQALKNSGDVHDALDGVATIYQLCWTVGLAALFLLHIAQRLKPGWKWLPWVLIPFIGIFVILGFVALVTMAHFG